MQVFSFFLKVGFHWTFPRDCTVGTSLGGTTRGILRGFPGRVLSNKLTSFSIKDFSTSIPLMVAHLKTHVMRTMQHTKVLN